MDDELSWMDGVALSHLVARKEVTTLDLVDSAIARAEHVNPALGCVIERQYDTARQNAASAPGRGRLAGVPIIIKNHLATQEKVRHTSGSRFLRDYIAPRDSELVTRYKAGGLIAIATSASSEFALLATGESDRYGACRNPWDLRRIAGGSSGGAAAAVAAGVVPIGHGNDAGGSIRIPASACGLFGLKPTRGRNPLGPHYGDMVSGLWAEHVVTRSVRDSAAVLDISAGAMGGDPYSAPAAPASFFAEVGRDPGRLRIGITTAESQVGKVSAECHTAVAAAASLCEDLGHIVAEVSLPTSNIRDFEDAFLVLYAAGAAWTLDTWIHTLGREPETGELEPYTIALAAFGRSFTAAQYLSAVERIQAAAREAAAYHANFDILLTPTVASPPPTLGHFTATVDQDPLSPLYADAEFSKFTWMANATGQPAMSMPLHWDPATGLPIGTHWTADVGREDMLLRLAAQLEEANPWAWRRPPMVTVLNQ